MPAAVAFDLDDTLAHSKSPVSTEMANLLVELAELVPVCIISGGNFTQFQEQVLRFLPDSQQALENFHLMPTCGTRYYRRQDGDWAQVYAEDLSEAEKTAAIEALESVAKELGLWEADDAVWGPRIEDRGSQITFSALGQRAPVEPKKAWDPDGSRREALRARLDALLPELEVRAGGSTSIDITKKGIDKAHGIRALAELLGVDFPDILFVGDRLEPGGNDYPVVPLGCTTHAVEGCDETLAYLPGLIAELKKA